MRTLALTIAGTVALAVLPSHAQSPLWEIHVNLQKTFASPLGQKVMQLVEQRNPDKLEDFAKFAEAIGLDPRTDIGEVVLFGNGFSENDATVIANIGQSTGNLEGWILAAPGYRSEDLDANTLLHSIAVEKNNARAWFALPKHSRTNNYIVVGSLDRDRTTGLARQVLSGESAPVPNPLEGNSLLKFKVNDLSSIPIEIDESEPGGAIVKTIEQLGLNIASDDDNLNVALELSASSSAKARQIGQLLTGLKALVQLAPMEDSEAKKVAEVLETLVVDHTEGQSNVRASLSAPYRLIEELLNEIGKKKRQDAEFGDYGN